MELHKDRRLDKEIKNMCKPLREDNTCLYAMATEAHHNLGNISRDEYDIAQVFEEDEDNYYGSWLTGYGFIGVRFPKSTTRSLTKEEIEYWEGRRHGIDDSYLFKLELKGNLL